VEMALNWLLNENIPDVSEIHLLAYEKKDDIADAINMLRVYLFELNTE
jgi:hypothetical protein